VHQVGPGLFVVVVSWYGSIDKKDKVVGLQVASAESLLFHLVILLTGHSLSLFFYLKEHKSHHVLQYLQKVLYDTGQVLLTKGH
jgi:hypothetical protein